MRAEHASLRELSVEEIGFVSGGGEGKVEYIDANGDGKWSWDETIVVTGVRVAASTDTSCGYWAIGGSLGIGLGLWGTCSEWGIAWNVGIGGYVLTGTADGQDIALERVGVDDVAIGIEVNGVPTMIYMNPRTDEITHSDISVRGGVLVTSPESSINLHRTSE